MSSGSRHRVLLLGGVDPCGGAGITADTVVAGLHDVDALPIAVTLTVQNRRGFASCADVDPRLWRAAFDAAVADGEVHAVKTGLLGSASAVHQVAAALRPWCGRLPIVVDPVLSATAGGHDPGQGVASAYAEQLVPLATLVTPNADEAGALFKGDLASAFASGCGAVLRKGGHDTGEWSVDVLVRATAPDERFVRRRLPVGSVHGTGCALATAIACALAHGADLPAAVAHAGDWLWQQLAALGPAPANGLPRSLPLASSAPVTRTSSR